MLLPSREMQAQDFNYKVNAMYIYYFAKYINWPEVSQTEELIIGIIGNSPVTEQLKVVIASERVYGKLIVIRKITPDETALCNIVVISKDEVALTEKVSIAIKNLPILLITEKEGYAKKGAQICIYVDDEDGFKTKFELSKSNIIKTNLKVSNELLTLGEIVK